MAAKRFEFAVSLDREGKLLAEERTPLEPPDEWTPEHLVLAALAQCTIASLLYHARLQGVDVTAGAAARGLVTKREGDGRYAFVELECRLDVEVDPLGPDEVADLLAKAERDCFIGASLTAAPRYAWRVNGEDVSPSL